VSQPDLVTRPEIAAFVLVHGMMNGTFTGKRLDRYINNSKTDYVAARRTVNGTDKASKIARYALEYEDRLLGRKAPAPETPSQKNGKTHLVQR